MACKEWLVKGSCSRGDSCTYSHAKAKTLKAEGYKLDDSSVIVDQNGVRAPWKKVCALKSPAAAAANRNYVMMNIDGERHRAFPDDGATSISVIPKKLSRHFASKDGTSWRLLKGHTVNLIGFQGDMKMNDCQVISIRVSLPFSSGRVASRINMAEVEGDSDIIIAKPVLQFLGIKSAADQLRDKMQGEQEEAKAGQICARCKIMKPEDEQLLTKDNCNFCARCWQLFTRECTDIISGRSSTSLVRRIQAAMTMCSAPPPADEPVNDLTDDEEDDGDECEVHSIDDIRNGKFPCRTPEVTKQMHKDAEQLAAADKSLTVQLVQDLQAVNDTCNDSAIVIKAKYPHNVDARHFVMFFIGYPAWDDVDGRGSEWFIALCETILVARGIDISKIAIMVNPPSWRSIKEYAHAHIYVPCDMPAHGLEFTQQTDGDNDGVEEHKDDGPPRNWRRREPRIRAVTTKAATIMEKHDSIAITDPVAAQEFLNANVDVKHTEAAIRSVTSEAHANQVPELPTPSPSKEELLRHSVQPQGKAYLGIPNWKAIHSVQLFREPLLKTTVVTSAALVNAPGVPAPDVIVEHGEQIANFPVNAWMLQALELPGNRDNLTIKGQATTTLLVRANDRQPYCATGLTMNIVESAVPCVILGQDVLNHMIGRLSLADSIPSAPEDEGEKIDAYLHHAIADVASEGVPDEICKEIAHKLLNTPLKKVFRLSLSKGHHADVPPLVSAMQPGSKPPKTPHRPYAKHLIDVIRKEIEKLELWGVISRDDDVLWMAALHLVRKPDGEWRMVVDDRYNNRHRVPITFPVADMRTLATYMGGVIWFSVADMKAGYHQLPIHPDSKQYHGLWTPIGKFVYNVLSMGNINAMAHFTKCTVNAFDGIIHRQPAGLEVYADDQMNIARPTEGANGNVDVAQMRRDLDDAMLKAADKAEEYVEAKEEAEAAKSTMGAEPTEQQKARLAAATVNADKAKHDAEHAVKAASKINAAYDKLVIDAAYNMRDHLLGNAEKGIEGYFERCLKKGFFLSPKKLQLMRRSVKFLGHEVSDTGIRIHPDRIQAVRDMPMPTTAAEVYQVYGFMQWCSDHIPKFAEKSAFMRDIIKQAFALKGSTSRKMGVIKNVKVTDVGWTAETTEQWEKLRTAFINSIENAVYDPRKVLCIHTDANQFHFSGCLTQCTPDELNKPIREQKHVVLACYSGSFKNGEINWDTETKETWPVVLACQKFQYLMWGDHPNKNFTDHSNIVWLEQRATREVVINMQTAQKLARWLLTFVHSNLETEHVAGEDNLGPDWFTRGGAPRRKDWKVARVFTRRAVAETSTATTPSSPTPTTPSSAQVAKTPSTAARVNMVIVQTPAQQKLRKEQQELSTDPSKVFASSQPWPTATHIKAVQTGLTNAMKKLLQYDSTTGLWYTRTAETRDVLKELRAVKPATDKNAVELFCGAGGSACGMHAAGADTRAAFDNKASARKVFEQNFPRAAVQDVDCLDAEELYAELEPYMTDDLGVQILQACPKCAWSRATAHDQQDEPSKQSYSVLATVFERLRQEHPNNMPKVVCGENVVALEEASDNVWQAFRARMRHQGYVKQHVSHISTKHVGLPQDRVRLYWIFIHESSKATCHLERIVDILRQQRHPVLGDMFDAECFYYDHRWGGRHLYGKDERLPALRQRCLYRRKQYTPNEHETANGFTLDNCMVWTVESLKQLQGFAPDFSFQGVSRKEAASLIGLSVSPNMAEIAIKSIDWDGKKEVHNIVTSLENYIDSASDKRKIFIPSGNDQCKTKAASDRADELVTSIIAAAHQGPAGHRGHKVVMNALQQLFFFKDMRMRVQRLIGNCIQCLKLRAPRVPRPLGATLLGSKPFEVITCDFFSLDRGNGYQLTIKDTLTGFAMLSWHPTPSAFEAAKSLVAWCSTFRTPHALMTDGGSHFVNRIMQKLRDKLGFKHHVHTADIHHSAGTIEVLQRACKRFYQAICSEMRVPTGNAEYFMPMLQKTLNHSHNERDRIAPITAATGLDPETPVSTIVMHGGPLIETVTVKDVTTATHRRVKKYVTKVREALDAIHRRMATQKAENRRRDRQRRAAQDSRTTIPDFSPGDYVWVARPTGAWDKLSFNWQGPYEVIKPYMTSEPILSSPVDGIDVSPHVFEVRLLGKTNSPTIKSHATRMRLYCKADDEPPADVIEAGLHDAKQRIPSHVGNVYTDSGDLELQVFWVGFPEPTRTKWSLLNNNGFVHKQIKHLRNTGRHLIDTVLDSIETQWQTSRRHKAKLREMAKSKTAINSANKKQKPS